MGKTREKIDKTISFYETSYCANSRIRTVGSHAEERSVGHESNDLPTRQASRYKTVGTFKSTVTVHLTRALLILYLRAPIGFILSAWHL